MKDLLEVATFVDHRDHPTELARGGELAYFNRFFLKRSKKIIYNQK
jgi:hypothetical protein